MPEALVISKNSLLLILNAADLYTINEKISYYTNIAHV